MEDTIKKLKDGCGRKFPVAKMIEIDGRRNSNNMAYQCGDYDKLCNFCKAELRGYMKALIDIKIKTNSLKACPTERN